MGINPMTVEVQDNLHTGPCNHWPWQTQTLHAVTSKLDLEMLCYSTPLYEGRDIPDSSVCPSHQYPHGWLGEECSWSSLVWHGAYIFMQVYSQRLCRHYGKSKKWTSALNCLYGWVKPCYSAGIMQGKERPSSEDSGMAFSWSNQNLSTPSKRWRAGMGRDSPPFLHLSGRQGCIEWEILPIKPSPSQLHSSLQWIWGAEARAACSWRGEDRKYSWQLKR